MPLLLNVPNFTGVRIHSGNRIEDTEGCILVGQHRLQKSVAVSIIAYNQLFNKMSECLKTNNDLSVEIIEL